MSKTRIKCQDCGYPAVYCKCVSTAETFKQWNIVKPEELLTRYSEFLEKYAYLDADWWAEKPNAVDRFIEEESETLAQSALTLDPVCDFINCEEKGILYQTSFLTGAVYYCQDHIDGKTPKLTRL